MVAKFKLTLLQVVDLDYNEVAKAVGAKALAAKFKLTLLQVVDLDYNEVTTTT